MPGETRESARAHLSELQGLVQTLGIPIVRSDLVNLREINPQWCLGSGKIDEISDLVTEFGADLVVFDTDLNPVHQRNLEKRWGVAVIDRREVILDIFADHAKSREAVLQVALARMQYSLPRLTRAWTHLSRQQGGAKGTRGKGETQLESDRRVVIRKISQLKTELATVQSQREVRRKRRLQRPVPSISLVGYTNAGKSSLLNKLCGTDVLVEDKLFATLDSTTRRLVFPGGREVLVSDTVGFIRKLPHDLVEAFHSTLEEAMMADVIVHVADASSPEIQEQIQVTESVLSDLDTEDTPRLLVLNKADRLSERELSLCQTRFPESLTLSAHTGWGIPEFLAELDKVLDINRHLVTVHLPLDRWDLHSRLHNESRVLSETCEDDGIFMKVYLNQAEQYKVADFIVKSNV